MVYCYNWNAGCVDMKKELFNRQFENPTGRISFQLIFVGQKAVKIST